jgi:hypothetical protein
MTGRIRQAEVSDDTRYVKPLADTKTVESVGPWGRYQWVSPSTSPDSSACALTSHHFNGVGRRRRSFAKTISPFDDIPWPAPHLLKSPMFAWRSGNGRRN